MRNVVLYPDNPLTQKAQPVKKIGPRVVELLSAMYDVMESHEGVGLAAPQVGKAQRIIVVHEPEKERMFCLINPEILEAEGNEMREEGCLSLPQIYAMVPRYTWIKVHALNEHGKKMDFMANGLLARIIQHEVDHLDGIIFLDRVDVLTREAKLREWQEIRKTLVSQAAVM